MFLLRERDGLSCPFHADRWKLLLTLRVLTVGVGFVFSAKVRRPFCLGDGVVFLAARTS